MSVLDVGPVFSICIAHYLNSILYTIYCTYTHICIQWYRNSPAHRQIVREYHGKSLEQFGAMLATLVPPDNRPIRWEVRCRKCRKMSPGPGDGRCIHCGDVAMHPLPYT